MKICQSVSSISRLGAGVSGFLLPLSLKLNNAAVDIKVISLVDKYSASDSILWEPLKPVLLNCLIKKIGYSSDFITGLNQINASLLHQHGLWLYPSLATLIWTTKHKIPRIVSPHGMLEPWAWNHNKWKKLPIWFLWEKKNMTTASAIHVTSEQEMFAVRSLGIKTPIAIIPIGIDILKTDNQSNTYKRSTKKTILFLSRIHPKKGIENLINAWQKIKYDDWIVIIAGPSDRKYLDELISLRNKLHLEDHIIFKDAVYEDEKWQLLMDSDIFVLPSYSENFGIVIAEALASGTPVITTKSTPWKGLIDNKCGWWIDIGVDPLTDALFAAMNLTDEQRHLMGQQGRQYMQREFNWQESTFKMKALYEWAINNNQKPDFVYL